MPIFDLLITVKTYPVPSIGYEELVCTAGICLDIGFMRLYPVRFRYLPQTQQYRKYQWIRVEAECNLRDPRPESYRPRCDSIELLGESLEAGDWAERKRIVLPLVSRSIEDLWEKQASDGTSLGIIRPARVIDLSIESEERDWAPRTQALLTQLHLFGPARKPLTKLPYTFRYHFKCADPRCKGHRMMIADWELGALYLKIVEESDGDEEVAKAKVRQKFLDELCGSHVDTHFFVGSMIEYPNSWIVLGVFYPPVKPQETLPFVPNV